MPADNVQLQRLELKYWVKEHTALAIRDFVSSYLALDEYGIGQPDLSYPVHSLYLDSDDLKIYWDTIGGNKNRYKLRIRYYNDNPRTPVFFEIKRRQNDAILKQRGAVHRNAVDRLLCGHLPERHHLLSDDPRQLVAVQRFIQHMHEVHARPKAHVAYMREAWISTHDNSVRVTTDRHVQTCPDPTTDLGIELENPVTPFRNWVILELKFTGRFPVWFSDLVRTFNLRQTAAAKYVDSLTLKGEDWFYGDVWLRSQFELRHADMYGRMEDWPTELRDRNWQEVR